ncbi:MAG TPA: hypothetical protein VGO27_09265, partial [Candidatus Acidoferrum sp.]|nr:hypothetical protein [Candidatus Acidoferrum sp.]
DRVANRSLFDNFLPQVERESFGFGVNQDPIVRREILQSVVGHVGLRLARQFNMAVNEKFTEILDFRISEK